MSDALSREEWEKAVKRRLGTAKFQVLDITVKELGGEGGGYLGEHRVADVTVRLEDSNESSRVLHFFYKTEPEGNAQQKEIVSQAACFQKEVNAVDNLFSKFRAVLKDNGDGMEWTCKCFYSRPDVVVLDNLVVQGFEIAANRDPFEFQHCALVLKALANLHSASLIFEETRPKQPYRLDSEFADMLAEGFFRHAPDHPGTPWQKTGIKAVWTIVEQIRGKEFLERAKTKLEEAVTLFYELEKPSKRFRNVANHGDLWRNNIFFRYEEGKPVEARLVDYQLVRYAPPANDISCFLHLSTDRALRDEYGPQLFALYYDYLSDNLKRHGLEAEKVLPWEEFRESCDYYKKLGITATPAYCSFIYQKKENVTHVFASPEEFHRFLLHDRTEEVLYAFKNDSYFRDKVTEVVEELIEICVDKEFSLA